MKKNDQQPTPDKSSTSPALATTPDNTEANSVAYNYKPILEPHPTGLLPRVWAHGLYESRVALSNGEQALVSIILPLMVLIGVAVTGFMDQPDGTSSIDMVTPGVLALSVVSAGLTGQGIATGFDRRYGVLRFLSTTPLGPGGLLLGKVLAVLFLQLTQVIVIASVALVLGWQPQVSGVVAALVFQVLGALAFTALGLLIAGTARPEATLALTNLLWVLLGAAGGIIFPVRDEWGGAILSWLPSSALGDGLRDSLINGQFDVLSLAILALWGVVAGLGVIRWFKWR